MLAEGESLDPPGEVIWVTYPHAKSDNLLEQRLRRHRQDFNAECIRRPIQLVLKLCKLPVLWRPRECGPEGGGPDCHICASGEVKEGPVDVSKQGFQSLVFFPPPEGICLQPCRPLISD